MAVEEARSMKKAHASPLFRYYSAAAVACIDGAVTVTSGCTLIPSNAAKKASLSSTEQQALQPAEPIVHFQQRVGTHEKKPSTKTVTCVQLQKQISPKEVRVEQMEKIASNKTTSSMQNNDIKSLKTVSVVHIAEVGGPPLLSNVTHPKKDVEATSTHMSLRRPASITHLPLHYQPPSPCSVCGKPMLVGWPTRCLSYAEIKAATNNFSRDNFLLEGESAFVYAGVLPDGNQVAVKSVGHRTAKFQSEVAILSSMQHPNVISLVGFCDEAGKAMLVYDFMCNGTLDWHLSGRNPNVVSWHARRVIAVQVARGLQFLHECRLGCLLHQDIRARNILLTHDYIPVIAGFGHASWAVPLQKQGLQNGLREKSSTGDIGTAGDVYAFGVLLLELISGRTVVDPHEDLQPLVAWARPLLLEDFEILVTQMLDPRLGLHYKHYELFCMANAASMCLRKNPTSRPSMRLILSCLEDARQRSTHLESSQHANQQAIITSSKRATHLIRTKKLASATQSTRRTCTGYTLTTLSS